MNVYNIVLFLHVSGAIGYFIAIGTWLFGLSALRRAQRIEQVRAIVHLIGLSGPSSGSACCSFSPQGSTWHSPPGAYRPAGLPSH
jgi:hypothetical protein